MNLKRLGWAAISAGVVSVLLAMWANNVEVKAELKFLRFAESPNGPLAEIEVANAGSSTFSYFGYSPTSPASSEKILVDGRWSQFPRYRCGTGMSDQTLKPGQKVVFTTAIPASGERHSFKVGLSYWPFSLRDRLPDVVEHYAGRFLPDDPVYFESWTEAIPYVPSEAAVLQECQTYAEMREQGHWMPPLTAVPGL